MASRQRSNQMKQADRHILRLHEAIADKVLAQPDLLDIARNNLEQRYSAKMMRYGSYIMWDSILALISQPEQFRQALLEDDFRMCQLRRQSIFTGVLSEEEREALMY